MSGYRTTEVVRITGVSYRMLDYWASTDFLRPSLRDASGSGDWQHRARLYSDEDVRLIRLTKKLLDFGFTLRAIRVCGPDALDERIRWDLTTVSV